MEDGKRRSDVRGMFVRGIILRTLLFIPLTIIPLTLPRPGGVGVKRRPGNVVVVSPSFKIRRSADDRRFGEPEIPAQENSFVRE